MVLDEKKIKKEAKQILDKFASALAKVRMETKVSLTSHPSLGGEGYVDRDVFERVEGSEKECGEGFKKKILKNAPESDDNFILVEKGGWK